jgi:hypothetical protein
MPAFFAMRAFSAVFLAASCVTLAIGCHSGEYVCPTDRCADIPKGAIPPPAGNYNCQWQTEQKGRANRDKNVVFHYEWLAGGDHLGPDGRRHLERIAKLPETGLSPIIIESSDDPALDETRRKALVQVLAKLGAPDGDQRVIIGSPEAEGLYGPEAVRTGNRFLGGQTGAAGGASGSGATTTGFGVGTTVGGGFGGMGGGMGIY